MLILKTVQRNFFAFHKFWKRIDLEGKCPEYYGIPPPDVCETATTKANFYSACQTIEAALVKDVYLCMKCKRAFCKVAGNIKNLNLGDIDKHVSAFILRLASHSN
jgi:hypothetical protein